MSDSLGRLLMLLIALGASLMLLGGAMLPSDAEPVGGPLTSLVQTVERLIDQL